MHLGTLTAQSLRDSVAALDSPHVDLGPLLGLDGPLRVGMSDVHDLLKSGEPAFTIEACDATLSVHRQDGGLMATLEVKW
jgi:hypothetical protein